MIAAAQLVNAGLGYSCIGKRAANGRLHRRYPGVYAVGQPRLSQPGEWIAATLACGHGAYLASLNAAVHMTLWRRRVTGIHVLEKALKLNKTGSAGTRCELEDRVLALTSRSGLPEPLVNTKSRTSKSTSTGRT